MTEPLTTPISGRWRDADDPRSHDVYRIFDADDVLLYVGCALDGESRIRSWHMNPRCAPTSVELHGRIARWTIETYPDKASARAAEKKAIETEGPLLNRQHNPRRSKRGPAAPVTLDEQRAAMQGVWDLLHGDAS